MLKEPDTRSATTAVPATALHLRPAADRGHADHGWLKSAHSFSFANYYNPDRNHFEALRVINDDWVAGGAGFPMHPHQDFEIFSYVLEGTIAHKDSMGNGSTVAAGGVQYMTAGSGVQHSEFNPDPEAPLKFLQIWLMPKVRGAPPRYETHNLNPAEKAGRLALFISEDGRAGSIKTLAPADVYAGTFNGDQTARFDLRAGRRAYLQVTRGNLEVNGMKLRHGDGLAITAPGRLTFTKGDDAEIVFFDLAELG